MPEYLRHADRLADDIKADRLRSGHQLPPLRRYAFEHGIAFSTASRVYAELRRRGLVSTEVGRGTFVRPTALRPQLSEPDRKSVIDLEFNSTTVETSDLFVLSEALIEVASSARAVGSAASSATSRWLRTDLLAVHLSQQPGWIVRPEHLLAAGGGRQAIAAAFATLGEPGTPIGLETFTYPLAKSIARRLGLLPVPLAMDAEGIIPEALDKAYNEEGLKTVYLQPTLHNPLGTTMGTARRQRLSEVIVKNGMIAVEDNVYGFLAQNAPPPIAALAPDNTVLIDSFSKRGFSGVPVGFLWAQSVPLRDRLVTGLREGAWLAAPMNLAIVSAILEAGDLDRMEQRKRKEAATRQSVLRAGLMGFDVQSDFRSFHAWLRLPVGWRADVFQAAALDAGVAVTAGANFSVQPGYAPDAVRLAFSSVDPNQFKRALAIISQLLADRPKSLSA